MPPHYPAAPGGHLGQDKLLSDRAVFTDAYAVIPRGTMRDITASRLPFWDDTRLWVLARPLSGFAETFSQYLVEMAPGGGSDRPDDDPAAQSVIFVTDGTATLTLNGTAHDMAPGGYAYIPPDTTWTLRNTGTETTRFQWIRKAYQRVDGLSLPGAFVTSESAMTPDPMPGTDGKWSTTRFVDPGDLSHDMHVNIVSFEPGAHIPFAETHVMEHGIFVLGGRGVYHLNGTWVEVESGDFLWLRAFCPQACYAGGPENFRYLLYKDVNRQMPLTPPR